jgi:hypothetical protein
MHHDSPSAPLPLSLRTAAAQNLRDGMLRSVFRADGGIYARLQPGHLLWIREPYRLVARFNHIRPTTAEALGARPHFATDLTERMVKEIGLGRQWPARNLLRVWHRSHAVVTAVDRVPLQSIDDAQARAEGHGCRMAWSRNWDAERRSFAYTDLWQTNPLVLRIAFDPVPTSLSGLEYPDGDRKAA